MKVGLDSFLDAQASNFSGLFWDSEENVEILNLKNAKNRLSGNVSDL